MFSEVSRNRFDSKITRVTVRSLPKFIIHYGRIIIVGNEEELLHLEMKLLSSGYLFVLVSSSSMKGM
jgi:hypothetical protein